MKSVIEVYLYKILQIEPVNSSSILQACGEDSSSKLGEPVPSKEIVVSF